MLSIALTTAAAAVHAQNIPLPNFQLPRMTQAPGDTTAPIPDTARLAE